MRSRAEVAVLAKVRSTAERDRREVVENDPGSDHGSGFEGKLPRKGHFGRGENNDALRFGYVCAKEPEQLGAKPMPWTWAPAKQRRLRQFPYRAKQNLAAWIWCRAILAEIRVLNGHLAEKVWLGGSIQR